MNTFLMFTLGFMVQRSHSRNLESPLRKSDKSIAYIGSTFTSYKRMNKAGSILHHGWIPHRTF